MRKLSFAKFLASVCLLCLLTLSINIKAAHAGAWMRSEGENLLSLSTGYQESTRYWTSSRKELKSACRSVSKYTGVAYEYGYSYYHTLFLNAGFIDKECGQQTASGVGDIRLGVRGRVDLFTNGYTWEVAISSPTGYNNTNAVRVGNGRFGLQLGIAKRFRKTGLGQRERKWYTEIGAGLNLWGGGNSAEAKGYGKYTYKLTDRDSLTLAINGTTTIGSGIAQNAAFAANATVSEYDHVFARARVSHFFRSGWGLSLSGNSSIIGRNQDKNNGLSINVSLLW